MAECCVSVSTRRTINMEWALHRPPDDEASSPFGLLRALVHYPERSDRDLGCTPVPGCMSWLVLARREARRSLLLSPHKSLLGCRGLRKLPGQAPKNGGLGQEVAQWCGCGSLLCRRVVDPREVPTGRTAPYRRLWSCPVARHWPKARSVVIDAAQLPHDACGEEARQQDSRPTRPTR